MEDMKPQNNEEINEEAKSAAGQNAESTDENSETVDKQNSKKSAKLEKENEDLKKELDEQKDKYLRLLAEYDNYRKRTQKEKTDAYNDAYSTALTAFLPLIDTLERAQEFVPDDEGIKACIKQLADILKSLNISVIESDGKDFDPNLHNAIMHEQDDSDEVNKVVQTFQKGYIFGEKVIRHAMVKVKN